MNTNPDIIQGRNNICKFLGRDNWHSVRRWHYEEGLPITKIEGRWIARRIHLEEWLTEKTGGTRVKVSENTQSFTKRQDWSRWRTPRMRVFLEALTENFGVISAAARHAKISTKTVYNWQKTYPRFAEMVESIRGDSEEEPLYVPRTS